MCDYYFDEDHGIAYKIEPVNAAVVGGREGSPTEILVHTDVKVTNIKKEKIRRTLAKSFSGTQYDLDSAKKMFAERLIRRLIHGARPISKEEYQKIKEIYEA